MMCRRNHRIIVGQSLHLQTRKLSLRESVADTDHTGKLLTSTLRVKHQYNHSVPPGSAFQKKKKTVDGAVNPGPPVNGWQKSKHKEMSPGLSRGR